MLIFGVTDKPERSLYSLPKTRIVVLDFLEPIYLDSTALEVLRAYQKSGGTLARRAGRVRTRRAAEIAVSAHRV